MWTFFRNFRYRRIQCGEVECRNCSSLDDSWYIPVHTGTYWYVLVQTETKQHTSLDHARSALLRTLLARTRPYDGIGTHAHVLTRQLLLSPEAGGVRRGLMAPLARALEVLLARGDVFVIRNDSLETLSNAFLVSWVDLSLFACAAYICLTLEGFNV